MKCCERDRQTQESGLTLVELIVVVAIIAIMTSFLKTSTDALFGWKIKGELRRFMGTWEMLFREAGQRGVSYALIVNLDNQSYTVRREVPIERDFSGFQQVDNLQGFRLQSEKDREERKDVESNLTVEQEFQNEDKRQARPLEQIFFETMFSDPADSKRLTVPLEFPRLMDNTIFSQGLRFKDIKLGSEYFTRGEVMIRFSARGGSPFALVHYTVNGDPFTLVSDPVTGRLRSINGEVDLDWTPFKAPANSATGGTTNPTFSLR